MTRARSLKRPPHSQRSTSIWNVRLRSSAQGRYRDRCVGGCSRCECVESVSAWDQASPKRAVTPQLAHSPEPVSALAALARVVSAPQVRRCGFARFAMALAMCPSIRCWLSRRDLRGLRLRVRMRFWCPRGVESIGGRACSLRSARAGPAKSVLTAPCGLRSAQMGDPVPGGFELHCLVVN